MVKIRTIQIRLTRRQYEQIKNDCKAKGFASLSAYLRFLSLYRDDSIANKVCEIHRAIISKSKDKKYKNKSSYENEQL